MARRDPVGIRLLTRRGNDWSARFPLVVEAVNHLRIRFLPDRRRGGLLRRAGGSCWLRSLRPVRRPTMRFVRIKSVEQQGQLMQHRTRDVLIRQRTQIINALRAHLMYSAFECGRLAAGPDVIR